MHQDQPSPLPDYLAARDRARAARAGTTLYPRLIVLDGTWCRQDYPGGPFEVLTAIEAAELLIQPREVA